MSDRPDLHTDDHENFDAGGYCNNLVLDADGTATDCGFYNGEPTTSPGPFDMLYCANGSCRVNTFEAGDSEDDLVGEGARCPGCRLVGFDAETNRTMAVVSS